MFIQISYCGNTYKTKSVKMSKNNAKKVAEDIRTSIEKSELPPKLYESMSGFLILPPEVIKQALFEVVIEYDDLYIND